jgi:site-specific DNA recombinase
MNGPMPRVVLYARYSSDNQRDASIEDQLRICREKAEREKWTIVSTYKDAGISGASMILRPGIQTLLQDSQRQQFDVVLAEALDRISRDQADVATLFKHLRFAGVQIVTLAEGEISELHVGLKGTMNAPSRCAARTAMPVPSVLPTAPARTPARSHGLTLSSVYLPGSRTG